MTPNLSSVRYFIYARKSSESEDRQVQSIDDQMNRLKELAQLLRLNVAEILTEAKSAKRPSSRPVFEDMLQRIEKGEADGILCWQINRLSRNPVDSGRLQMMLQDGVIKSIRTIDREYQPSDNVLLFSVESGMANQFILDLRKNTLRGLESKVSKGWLPARAPTGYLNDLLSKTIVKDPERFSLVRKMWDLMLTGNYNPKQIVKIANDEWSFRTEKRNRMGDRPLAISSAYHIFINKFYAGIVPYAGKEYPGAHEPMISIDEFDRVQVLLGKKEKPRPQTREFAFTGIIRCATCGCLVTAEEKKKHIKATGKIASYTYYRCTRRKQDIECKEPAVTLGEIERQIGEEILKFTIDPEFRDFALGIIRKNNDVEIESRTKARAMLESSHADLQRQLDNLTRMRYRDLIDDETFARERMALQQGLDKAQRRLNETHDRSEEWIELAERAFNFATHAYAIFKAGDIQTKREIFSAIGTNYILKDGVLKIEPMEWIVPISNAREIIKKDIRRLEPFKIGSINEKTPAVAEVYSRWGGLVDDFRTLDWPTVHRELCVFPSVAIRVFEWNLHEKEEIVRHFDNRYVG